MNHLIVVDVQVDFVMGALGSDLATAIVPIAVDTSYSAGVSVESHNTTLNVMRAVQIETVG